MGESKWTNEMMGDCCVEESKREMLTKGFAFPIEIKELTRIDWKPGDVFVLHCDHMPHESGTKQIAEEVERNFPGCKALVLYGGLKLSGVLRKD